MHFIVSLFATAIVLFATLTVSSNTQPELPAETPLVTYLETLPPDEIKIGYSLLSTDTNEL